MPLFDLIYPELVFELPSGPSIKPELDDEVEEPEEIPLIVRSVLDSINTFDSVSEPLGINTIPFLFAEDPVIETDPLVDLIVTGDDELPVAINP